MSEEQEPEIEVIETPVEAKTEPETDPVVEAAQVDIAALVEQAKNPPQPEEQPQEEPKQEFDPKRDRVDFDTPEQQAKFNDVYKQMKNSDARNQMLMDMMQEQQKQLDELNGRFRNEEAQAAETVLLDKIMTANEDGDTEKLTQSINELTKFRTDGLKDGLKSEIIEEIVNKTNTEKERDAQSVLDFMNQTNEAGEYLHPWMQQGHPQHEEFIKKSAVIGMEIGEENPDDPNLVYKTIERVNREMMSWEEPKPEPKPQPRTPEPMAGSHLTQQVPRNKIKMTDAEIDMARKLNMDPKKYASSREKLKQSGGVRFADE